MNESIARRPARTPRRQSGAALVVALVLLVAVTLVSAAAVSTSNMELRMAHNLEAISNTFQTALAAVDFVISDPANLPTVGPLNSPTAVALAGNPFTVGAGDSITAQATRLADCSPPPRMRNATSMTAYSAFNFEVSASVDKNQGGMGQSGVVQGYTLLGPKC